MLFRSFRFLIGLAMYLAQTLQTQLGVLRILHERYKLSNRALHLSDDKMCIRDRDCSYCCKISRDADIFVDDATSSEVMVEQLRKKVKKRKIGAVCRFVYDRKMPADYLEFLVDAFGINRDDLVPGDKPVSYTHLMRVSMVY